MKQPNYQKVDLNKIELSTTNPRYTILDSLETNLVDFISKENVNYEEKEVIIKLFQNESNFKDLISLANSIKNYDFDSDREDIIVIPKKKKDNFEDKYIIAEGNRRIMLLKLFLELTKLPNEEIKSNILKGKQFFNIEETFSENIEFKEAKQTYANYQKLKKILKDINKDLISRKVKVRVVEESDILWKLIYNKHIAGEKIGMRKWPRGKYFVDLLNVFSDSKGVSVNNEKLKTKAEKLMGRDFKVLIRDYKHAQFVRDIFRIGASKTMDDAYKTMTKVKVAALQSNFSFKAILNISFKEFGINENDFKENYFNFDFHKENNLIFYKEKKINKKDILNFILKAYNDKLLTTRGVVTDEAKKTSFVGRLKQLLSLADVGIDINKKTITNEEFKILPIFDLEVEKINEYLENSPDLNFINKEILKKIKSVKNKSDEFNKQILSLKKPKKPSYIFNLLKEQFRYNSSKNFLNALAISARAILEQFLLWGIYFINFSQFKKILKNKENKGIFKNKNIANFFDSEWKSEYAKAFLNGEIYNILRIKTNNKNELKNILSPIIGSSDSEVADFILNRQNIKFLHKCVHALPTIIFSKPYLNNFSFFDNTQKILISAVKNIDKTNLEKFDEILLSHKDKKSFNDC